LYTASYNEHLISWSITLKVLAICQMFMNQEADDSLSLAQQKLTNEQDICDTVLD